jgi:hypothetical protein
MIELIFIGVVFVAVGVGQALIAAPAAFLGALISAGVIKRLQQQGTSRDDLIVSALIGGIATAAVLWLWPVSNPWVAGALIAVIAGALALPMKKLYHSVSEAPAT